MSSSKAPWPTALAESMAGQGPVPFRDFMAEALYADKQGFYTRRDLRRRRNRPSDDTDYHLELGHRVAQLFVRFARSHAPRIVEQGAGTGRLMRSVLRLLSPELLDDVEVIFIEPRLARRTRLLTVLQEFGVEGRVVGSTRNLESGPAMVLAKELLSAFPVHWVERTREGWREVHVTFDEDRWTWEESLETTAAPVQAFLDQHGVTLGPGERYEAALQTGRWLGPLAASLDPGLVLVMDRFAPDPRPVAGTVEAIRDGEPVAPYEAPGEVELSAALDPAVTVALARENGLDDVTGSLGLTGLAQPHLGTLALGTGDLDL